MFGFVTANLKELTREQQARYGAVYCGICRQIRQRSSPTARLGLSYDMAFLALLLSSLYEPQELSGKRACHLHPFRRRAWLDNEYIQYAADMNVILAYFKALDDEADEPTLRSRVQAALFSKNTARIEARYPRQCRAVRDCISTISRLESENCPNPDAPANAFGQLMGELLVYHEDLWAPTLRKMGMALGRFIYLGDAIVDYRHDKRRHKYNPYLAMGVDADWARFEEHLILAMSSCTHEFEKLPLVQDKLILNNILYSGVWCNFRSKKNERRDGVDS